MRRLLILAAALMTMLAATAQRVTVNARGSDAAAVFRSIMEQTGKNFVYSTDLLRGVKVTVNARNRPLDEVLRQMFRGTEIEFSIRGNNVVLKRRKEAPERTAKAARTTPPPLPRPLEINAPAELEEVVVVSRLEDPQVETAEMGAAKISARQLRATPVIFGEPDIIKTLQHQAGVAEGTEGLAGMHVHGGETDQNLYMLDNVPIYQVNHLAGLFSAFNTDMIRYADFFKTSFPAKYDGRLSSFTDVRLRDGDTDGHHGSARMGLTSGAFSIGGPLGDNTTYAAGIRRSWLDVLTVPLMALANAHEEDEKIDIHYYFMDLNAKVTHRFSPRLRASASVYFGDDRLKSRNEDTYNDSYYYGQDYYDLSGWHTCEKSLLHWGNLVAQGALNWRLGERAGMEITAAYTRYFSSIKYEYDSEDRYMSETDTTRTRRHTDNNISDWIVRADLDWRPREQMRIRTGAGYTLHSFLPCRTDISNMQNGSLLTVRDNTRGYGAHEASLYIEDDWRISRQVRVNGGIHLSLFAIDGKVRHGVSPRLAANWRPAPQWAVKGAYSRTVQYVRQLSQSYLALPTDLWIPVAGRFRPESADKIAAGVYWQSPDGVYTASAEGYWKWMHNLIDYRDNHLLQPPLAMWDSRLTAGRGTARGIDLTVERTAGKVTGRASYSLAWADRTFPEKNHGRTYPARFDNRHTINLSLTWTPSRRISLSASWTGHSGNRFTLMPQEWVTPSFGSPHGYGEYVPLQTQPNNYRLPFYHRLDLSLDIRNSRGYWNVSLYNAYCHMNTVAIRRSITDDGRPVFQKVKLIPIIPSISYTWLF